MPSSSHSTPPLQHKNEQTQQPIERRQRERSFSRKTAQCTLTSHLWELELLPSQALPRLANDITSLFERSVDQNLFFETDILSAAWPRLTNYLAPRGCWMLCLWETIGDQRTLRLFMPIRLYKNPLSWRRHLQTLANEFMPIGTPLVDHDCAEQALETLLRLLADPALEVPPVFDFTCLYENAATTRLLIEACEKMGLKALKTHSYERACLTQQNQAEGFTKMALGKKSIRELKRQKRKLAAHGDIQFTTAQNQDQILDDLESFLIIELHSWKGRAGTALYSQKQITTFSRQMVATLATKNCCKIVSLKLDERIIASLILLHKNGLYMPWKMTFDEGYKNYSPGMQLMAYASEKLVIDPSFIWADSLASSDHWMMNRIWPERISLMDYTVALTPKANKKLRASAHTKRRFRILKQTAKQILARFKKA